MILHIFTWDHGRPVSSLIYETTGGKKHSSSTESTLSKHINQNQELHAYHWQNNSSSYAKITPQSFCQVLQTQADQIGGDVPYLLQTQQQTRFRTMHSKQCATHYQIYGASGDRITILGMSIFYARWKCTRRGIFTKRQVIWKSCGHSMPLPSGEFSKTYQHRVGG